MNNDWESATPSKRNSGGSSKHDNSTEDLNSESWEIDHCEDWDVQNVKTIRFGTLSSIRFKEREQTNKELLRIFSEIPFHEPKSSLKKFTPQFDKYREDEECKLDFFEEEELLLLEWESSTPLEET